jgi:solute carrier family 25 phosphate transporter 23/24/25/41
MKDKLFNESQIIDLFKFITKDSKDEMLINENDLQETLQKFGIPKNYFNDIFTKMDVNKDNLISFDEFKAFINKKEKDLLDLYNEIDTNKDGKLTKEEFEKSFSIVYPGKKFDENFINNLIQMFDVDKNGTISFEEFRNILVFLPESNMDFLIRWSQEYTVLMSELNDAFPLQFLSNDVKQKGNLLNFLKNFLAGGLAAALSKTLTAPLDRLKTLYQTSFYGFDKPPGMLRGLYEIFKHDGFRGYFRGNFVNILKSSPELSIRLASFELLKSIFEKNLNNTNSKNKNGNLSAGVIFTLGAIAGVVSSYAVYPLSVVKTRLTAAPTGTYKGVADCFMKIAKYEGKIKPFFSGITASTALIISGSGLSLMTYDMMRNFYINYSKEKEIPLTYLMIIGALSSGFTNFFCYPLQLVTTKMMMQGLKGEKASTVSMTKKIYRKQGFYGFYKGFLPLMNKIMLGNAISFSAYEKFKGALNVSKK